MEERRASGNIRDVAYLVGRRRLLKGVLAAAAIVAVEPLLSACGKPSTVSGATAPTASSARILQGALASAAQGEWEIWTWRGTPETLPEIADDYGITDPLDMTRAFDAEGINPTMKLAVDNGRYRLESERADEYFWLQVGDTSVVSGDWWIDRGTVTVAVPLTPQEEVRGYSSASPTAAGVPDPLVGGDNGKFKWEWRLGSPDYVTYAVKADRVLLFTPNSEYCLLAVRASA